MTHCTCEAQLQPHDRLANVCPEVRDPGFHVVATPHMRLVSCEDALDAGLAIVECALIRRRAR